LLLTLGYSNSHHSLWDLKRSGNFHHSRNIPFSSLLMAYQVSDYIAIHICMVSFGFALLANRIAFLKSMPAGIFSFVHHIIYICIENKRSNLYACGARSKRVRAEHQALIGQNLPAARYVFYCCMGKPGAA
jgi:hypothetical protein